MADSMPASDLRNMSVEQLQEQLEAFRVEHQQMLQRKHSQSVEPGEMRVARKNIARCTHILREKEMAGLVEEYRGKRFIPKELRPKLNRALRRKLTDKQKNARVRSVRIHAAKYPKKIFSLSN